MAKAWCLRKPAGKAVIGIPVGPSNKIVFNSHKIYGPKMQSHLIANWKLENRNLDLNLFFIMTNMIIDINLYLY